jgi:hypothetical protein
VPARGISVVGSVGLMNFILVWGTRQGLCQADDRCVQGLAGGAGKIITRPDTR